MKTLTKIEKKAMCIVLSAGYASGKTPSSVLNIFDEHCKENMKCRNIPSECNLNTNRKVCL